MAIYTPPLRDLRFVLHELLDVERALDGLHGREPVSAELLDAILEEAGKLCQNELLPTSAAGDEQGCALQDGAVRTPEGFPAAYRALVDGGWPALSCAAEHGGQGLPETVKFAVEEMVCSSNVAFALYPGLTHGAYRALAKFASDDIKQRYLPRLASGEWSGTMCLTESHCGTDLGLMRSRAEPAGDGSYRVTGTKIFITGGDQDLTDNIVHLVLARIAGAPAGVRGISLFVVPKYLPDASGEPGQRNAVAVGSLEKKMGIKGASTCVMNFEGATGWLVGEENRGLHAMFSMMNHERLWVGLQGLAIAETAYQSAAAYARDRLQGRSVLGPVNADGPADPIIVHPDVRRMLLTTRAMVEGARALYLWTAVRIDQAEHHPDARVRESAEGTVALLTPIIKAFLSDIGYEGATTCQQVFGGHGYIREWGMEQLVRDARITQIYEGTNGVQAMDLVGRKLPMAGGEVMRAYLAELEGFAATQRGQPGMDEFVTPLEIAIGRLRQGFEWLLETAAGDPAAPGAAAVDFLRLMGMTALAHMWAASAARALPAVESDNTGFYAAKLTTARYFMRRLLPQTAAHLAAVQSGSDLLMEMPAEAF